MLSIIRTYTQRAMSIKKAREDIKEIQINKKGRSLYPSEYIWVDTQSGIMELDIILTKMMIAKPILLAVIVACLSTYYEYSSTFSYWLSAAATLTYVLILFWQNATKRKRLELSERLSVLLGTE